MTNEPTAARLVLLDRQGPGRITVDMDAFFEFSFWLSEELQDLVRQWSHVAADRGSHSKLCRRRHLP